MKRSNRLILLVGIFLAIVAFVLIVITLGSPKTPTTTEDVTKTSVVVAARDMPLGTKITADAVKLKEIAKTAALPDSFGDPSAVIGQTIRESVTAEQQLTSATLEGDSGVLDEIEVPAGFVAIALQVDQVSGVGTLTKSGDHVDLLIGLTGDKFPVVTLNPDDNSVSVVSGLNSTSVKLLLQGMQVLGTLLPPPTGEAAQGDQQTNEGTALTGQQQIVILAVTAQQAEVIKYAQLEGNISLVLRAASEFIDPATGQPLPPNTVVPVITTGITLKGIVDDYGVLVPELVEAVLPEQARP